MSGAVIGGIEIQMLADLARLRQDMGDAKTIVGNATQELQRMASLAGKALGAIGVGLSLKAVHDMVSGFIDAAEALHDMSIQTGVSVENLSALQAIGRTTGTSAETISGVMNKLAKNMAVANEESKGTGAAIKALGLDFNTFKALKPDQQLLTLAQAMAKFEDGGGKSAVAMTLMGKEGAKLLPFMKDLASTGELVATTTSDQAAEADRYNDSVEESRMAVEKFQRSMAMALLPTMVDLHSLTSMLGRQIGDYLAKDTAQASKNFDGMGLVIRVVGTTLEALVVLASDVAFVFKSMGNEIGGLAAQAAAFLTGNFAGAAEIGRQMKADAAESRAQLDAFQASILGTTDRIMQSRDALRNHSLSSAENNAEMARLSGRYGTTKLAVLDFSAEGDAAAKKARDALDKQIEGYNKLADSVEMKLATAQFELDSGRKLTEAEKEYIKVMADVRDGKTTLAQADRDGAVSRLQASIATEAGIEVSKADVAWMIEATKANQTTAEAIGKRTEQLREALAQDLESNAVIGMSATQLAARSAALYRDQAAALDRLAVEKDLVDWSGRMGQELRDQADLLRQRAAAAENGAVIKEAKAAAEEWKKTTDSINAGLTDALMRAFESGKGFWTAFRDTLVNAAKTLVLKPVIELMVKPVGSAVGVLLGGASGTAAAGTGAGAGGTSLMDAATWYRAAQSLGNGFGAVGDAVGSGAAWMQAYSGSSYGTAFGSQQSAMLAAQDAGMGSSAGGWGSTAGSAASIAAGVAGGIYGGRYISGGYSIGGGSGNGMVNTGTAAGALVGSIIPGLGTALGAFVGGLLGGVANRAFGHGSTEAKAQGITGMLGAGSFAGSAFADLHRDGGWFTSDQNWTEISAMPTELQAALAGGAAGILDQARKYGRVLALPVEQLATVTTQARIELGSDAAANAKAITQALGAYGDALTATFAADLAGAGRAGESTLQTLERLGSSLLTLNGVFDTLSLHLVDTSVAGGMAASDILTLTGGLDAFLAKTQGYLRDYFTEAEQMGITAQAVMGQLGAAGIDFGAANDRGDLRTLLESLDPNSATGGQQIAALLNVASDYAKLADYLAAQGLTLQQLAGQAPQSVGLTAGTSGAGGSADASTALLSTANNHLTSIADSSQGSQAQLQALVALQSAANQALLVQLQSMSAALEAANRPAYLGDMYEQGGE